MERIWVTLPEKDAKAHMTRALETGFGTFITTGDVAPMQSLAKVRLLTENDAGIHENGALIAPRVRIHDVASQAAAMALAGRHERVLVDADDWRVIPYENLIAAYRAKGTQIIARAKDVDDARLLLETLERGVDIVLIDAIHAPDAAKRLAGPSAAETLAVATIRSIRPVGSGDRACLDTASLLEETEGVLTGGAAGALFLVASEARESGYVASRPFRVNAGPVHAYVLGPGGRTRYLSELRAGDEVLVCGPDGRTRSVVLGRVKIERRPLILVEAEVEGRLVSTLLQNAETIRLVGPDGTRSVVDLQPGDTVFLRLESGGRHFGMAVDESLVER